MDDGAGALIAAAAGDVAGGADPVTYSAITQTATVVAYHLLTNDAIARDELATELVELAGGGGGRFTYRMPSKALDEWLDSSRAGTPSASPWPSSEPAARAVPIGVFFRNRADDLVRAAITSSRVTHIDAATAVVAAAVAGAVAGSCYAQSGADLVLGAAETAERACRLIEEEAYRFGDVPDASAVVDRLRGAARSTGSEPQEIVEALVGSRRPEGVDGAILGIVVGAASFSEPIRLIEAAADSGGSEVGAVTGGIVGARSGLVQWPWRVQNDTWFAELGRRLVAGRSEVRDLPIPYAVEERMMMAPRAKPSEETI